MGGGATRVRGGLSGWRAGGRAAEPETTGGTRARGSQSFGMRSAHTRPWGHPLILLALAAISAFGWGQAPSGSDGAVDSSPRGSQVAVPAFRQADRVAIITLEGEIDATSELSVKRRIKQAEASGADAIVIEIDSPGGEVGAVLEISNAIKASSIANTVAWINPDAYSGGAIVALACREIVTSDPASMGDAFPITMGPSGIRGLTADERTKILPPLLSDVADSARRSGFDEYLVQAMVVDGIELWAALDTQTNEWVFINETEYRTLFESDPPRGKPLLTSVPNGRASSMPRRDANALPTGDTETTEDTGEAAEAQEGRSVGESTATDAAPTETEQETAPPPRAEGESAFLPANESVADLSSLVSQGLDVASDRPVITAEMRGRFTEPAYVCDGTGPIVLRDDQLERFGLTSATINSDDELKAFFGAKTLARTNQNWSEHMVRFLTSLPVRGLLIVLLLLGLFFEMVSPGTMVGGGVAVVALAALLAPPALIGMANWWEIVAIGLGLVFVLIEVLVIPGFGVFGVLGVLLLFGGLIGTFIPDGSGGLFGAGGSSGELFGALTTVILAVATASVGAYFISKHFGSLPLLNKLILGASSDEEDLPDSVLAAAAPLSPVMDVGPGDVGVAVTTLRPSGRVIVGGHGLNAVAKRGIIDANRPIRIVRFDGFDWVVEPADGPPGHPDSLSAIDDADEATDPVEDDDRE